MENQLTVRFTEKNKRNLKLWCGALLIIFAFFAYQLLDYQLNLYRYEEIDKTLCQELIAKELSKRENAKISTEHIQIIDIQLVNNSVVAGFVYTDYLSLDFDDKYNKGFILFKPEKSQKYEKYYVKQFEFGRSHNGYLEKDRLEYEEGKYISVSTVYNTFWTQSKSSNEYYIFLSDNPALQSILIQYGDNGEELSLEIPVEQVPFMYIVERTQGRYSIDVNKR